MYPPMLHKAVLHIKRYFGANKSFHFLPITVIIQPIWQQMDNMGIIYARNTTPGLESLFDFGNGQDVGADLSGDSG